MFSGVLQRDLFKGRWSLEERFFKQNYCHALFAVFSPLSSCCVSPLISIYGGPLSVCEYVWGRGRGVLMFLVWISKGVPQTEEVMWLSVLWFSSLLSLFQPICCHFICLNKLLFQGHVACCNCWTLTGPPCNFQAGSSFHIFFELTSNLLNHIWRP